MRFARSAVAPIVAILIAGCGGTVAAPPPDPTGDAAFVAGLKRLCSKTPALVPVDPSASQAAITTAANANTATVVNFVYGPPIRGPYGHVHRHGGLSVLTPKIASSSPFAGPVTDAAAMALDMGKWYGLMLEPGNIDDRGKLRRMAGTVLARNDQARSDLAKIGATDCLT